MARPTTKNDLIETAGATYDKLMELLDSMTTEQLTGTFSFDIDKEKGEHWKRDRNIHDVLIHLYEWQQLLLDWVTANQNGENKQFLKEGYNWKTYGGMNVDFVEKHKDSSYDESLALLKESHVKVIALAESLSNEELFAKKVFPWVGGSALGSYFVSTTVSHYDWAIKKIRKYKKSIG